MAYEGPRNRQGLTPRQSVVLEYDRRGFGPVEIARLLGVSPSQVGNIKKWLRENGFPVSKLRRLSQEMPKEPVPEVTARDVLDETDVPRSEHEPDDDEQPDDDEPAFTDLERCHCGLIKPCYHKAQSVWQSGDGNRYESEQVPSEIEPIISTKVRRQHW